MGGGTEFGIQIGKALLHDAIGGKILFLCQKIGLGKSPSIKIAGAKRSHLALFDQGIKTVITTLGASGYEIATQGDEKVFPCIKITPVDTTAAGDTACGGLCAELSLGKDIYEAMAFGSRAASIACIRKGAQMSVPSRDEVISYKG